MFGKKSLEKSEKNGFFIFTQISLPKNGWEKTREIIFPETQDKCFQKMLGKKSSEKSAKNFFFYSHEYRDQKMGGKNARNNFSRNTLIVRTKNVRKKSSEKGAKNVFYIHTNIVIKK